MQARICTTVRSITGCNAGRSYSLDTLDTSHILMRPRRGSVNKLRRDAKNNARGPCRAKYGGAASHLCYQSSSINNQLETSPINSHHSQHVSSEWILRNASMEQTRDLLVEKVQTLSDLELAALVCLVAEQHCIVESERQTLDNVEEELKLVSKTFNLTTES